MKTYLLKFSSLEIANDALIKMDELLIKHYSIVKNKEGVENFSYIIPINIDDYDINKVLDLGVYLGFGYYNSFLNNK